MSMDNKLHPKHPSQELFLMPTSTIAQLFAEALNHAGTHSKELRSRDEGRSISWVQMWVEGLLHKSAKREPDLSGQMIKTACVNKTTFLL